jgi:hypothetical protein
LCVSGMRCGLGICPAFLLAPVHRWLMRRLKGRVGLPAGIIALRVSVLPPPARCSGALLALLSVGGDVLVWGSSLVFASTSQLGSTIIQLIRGAGVAASGNPIRPLLICSQTPVRRRYRRLGLRHHWRDHRAGVADSHGRSAAGRRRDTLSRQPRHPRFVPDYTLRQAEPTTLRPVCRRAGRA